MCNAICYVRPLPNLPNFRPVQVGSLGGRQIWGQSIAFSFFNAGAKKSPQLL